MFLCDLSLKNMPERFSGQFDRIQSILEKNQAIMTRKSYGFWLRSWQNANPGMKMNCYNYRH